MKKFIATLLILSFFLHSFCQDKIPVFVSGTEGYKSFRIPAIIRLPNKVLLAFCEGRVNGASDFGNVDIVMKKSADNGKTWSALQIIVDADSLQAGNCAPVVDTNDQAYPQGRIFLFYNTGNNNEGQVRKGNGIRQVWYKTSIDDGRSWSKGVNITAEVHRPRQPQINQVYNFSEDWRSFANTPGHAMQFQKGKYKGRIFISANHSQDAPKKDFTDYVANGYYTDDHGKTFRISDNVSIAGSNESMAAELSNDRLMMNSRNQRGDIRARIVSISSDGGATWDTTYFDKTLIDPVNQGSILTLGSTHGKNIIAFCNAADVKSRNHLTLRISYDDGRTWKRSYKIDGNDTDSKKDYTAYSDLVKLGKNKIGLLYEKDNYKEIVFTAVTWK
ncbi:exo-alpha-sialidase [Ginsengibacter hankyongi]|uniref:exo-alpha-sialidase n=1 Tax=Ginsengibacter hankyongi TaxID=2607284 RepID=A0A5J5IJF4_9BACT|nr:sialidase family protein [Ginsengibacter hankyongi]KAA9040513.1 exo-alpha-sialidase [Ginsengibacter hankyongi]